MYECKACNKCEFFTFNKCVFYTPMEDDWCEYFSPRGLEEYED